LTQPFSPLEPAKRFARFGVATVVLFAASVSPLLHSRTAQAAAGEINGTVFNDWNQDGVRQTGEPGLAGVTVTVVSEAGAAVSTATGADGSFTVGGLSGRYRVEFSGQAAGMYPSRAGAGSATSVQFADSGTTVSAAFASPSDYCQANPNIALACFQQSPGFAASLRTTPYSGGALTQRAAGVDTGSTYGVAYHRQSKTIYQAAFMKRGVPIGPGGLGAIYKTSAAGGATGLFSTIPDAGANPRPASPNYLRDSEAFSAVYKMGLGDIDMSADDMTLYAVNLANNGLYSVAVNPDGTAGAVSGPITVSAPSDCSGEFHVFGLGVFGARGMVGGVCATGTLRAYVFEFVAQGAAATLSATPVFSFAMDYAKGEVLSGGLVTTPDSGANPWLPWNITDENESRVTKFFNGSQELRSAPQGQVSDLVLNDRGDLAIGLRDRFGDQGGTDILGVVATDTGIYDFMSGGDLLLACASGTTWTLEANGSCGGRAGSGVGNNQGPGTGEFFNDDFVNSSFPTGPHPETSLGSLLRVPGKSEIIATVYDPNTFYSNGLTHFADTNGAASNKTEIQIGRSTFGKANGLGDIEAMCDQAPIEIGNRVWLDANGNGVQDPADAGISGVEVQLFKGATKVSTGTVFTASNGTYYFNESNVPGGIVPGATDYAIQVPNAVGASQQSALTGYSLTAVDAAGTGNDVRDSDASASGSAATIAVPGASIAGAGMNNHTFDVGFTAAPALTYSLGNRVWFDTNNNGSIDPTEVGATAVKVGLLDSAGAPIVGRSTSADTNGHYRFDGLSAGDYRVCVDAENFAAGGALAGYASSTPTEADPDADVDLNDNGLQPADASAAVTTCIESGVVTLGGSPVEPSGEADKATTPGESPDAQSNLTVDFGFYKTAIGNTVWLDANNDGDIDTAETRLADVVVELRDSVCGVVLGRTTTNASGEYLIQRTLDGGAIPVGVLVTVAIPAAQTPLNGLEPSTPTGTADSFNHGSLNATGATCSAGFTIDPGTTTGGQLVDNASATTSNPTLDFGFNGPLASVGDRVWNDINKNGQQDPGEPGVANVVVELLKPDGTVSKSMKTDSNGLYRFVELQPGTCSIRFVRSSLPSGATFTVVDSGPDVSDSDADQTTGLIKTCTIGKREYVSTIDAGVILSQPATPVAPISVVTPVVTGPVAPPTATLPPTIDRVPTPAPAASSAPAPVPLPAPAVTGCLASTVWLDINENGELDGTESPISSAQLRITGPNGFAKLVATDETGKYDLCGLTPGEYTVEITGVGLSPQQKLLTGKKVSVQVLGTELSAPTAAFRLTIPGQLALTGNEVRVPAWTGAGLIALGLVLTGLSRRRPRTFRRKSNNVEGV
jgi:SdrD B-like domain